MNAKRLTTQWSMAAVMVLAAWTTGCGSAIVGTWENTTKPEGQSFYIHNATFKDDGSYTASAKQGEDNIRLAGKYEFDGFNLKLMQAGKPERKYSATYMMMGKTLQLREGQNKQTLKKK